MKHTRILGISLLSSLSLLILSACGLRGAKAEEESVRTAAAEFYVALNVLFTGDAGPMNDVWSHRDDISYMGPEGGLEVGWDAVEKIWDDVAAMKLGGAVKSAHMHVNAGGRIAIASNYEVGENVGADGMTQRVSIRATNIFRKEAGKWKMIGHHTDLLPFMAQP